MRLIMKRKIIHTLFLLSIISLIFLSCKDISSVSNENLNVPVQTKSSETTPAPYYTAVFSNPDIYGCQRAIISASINLSEKSDKFPTSIGFDILELNGHQVIYKEASIIDNNIYCIIPNLRENTSYNISIWVDENGKKIVLNETLELSTPKRSISMNDIEKYIYDEISQIDVDEEKRLLLETQACLALLGMETGNYGSFNSLMQSNLCRLEYSLNSKDDWINFDKIVGEPNEHTLKILKDILSSDILLTEKDIIHDFTPTPYFLSKYAALNEQGGSLEIELYIMEKIRENEEIEEYYNLFPFDKTSPEFKNKYDQLINNYDSNEAYEKKLEGLSAKNKAQFSNKARVWLGKTAVPFERLILLAKSDNEVTINTLLAYSYLFIDAYRDTGRKFKTSTTYRTYAFQWDLYSKGVGRSVSFGRNESWHTSRQKLSYVPGFSNHQYGVAIDFHERETFGETELYDYLNNNGSKYGFFNYYIEPWHWVYLGIRD